MSATATETSIECVPIHKWTHDVGCVLLVKCVARGGKSYNDFQWPTSGPVKSPNFGAEPTCESGGLFGWAWGLNIGGGKEPNYAGDWIVFAAAAETVVDIECDKQKVPEAEVVYYGDWHGALQFTRAGREAWLAQMFETARKRAMKSRETHSVGPGGAASSTGPRGAASSTGFSGAASSTGFSGAASSTGDSGAASSTGFSGAASSTGYSGAASSTGPRGAASSTGPRGAASSTGPRGAASSTGPSGAASSTGYRGAASSTGYSGAASSTGDSGAASSTGPGGAASSTGDRGAASSTGDRGAASSTGYRGAAILTGNHGTIEVGPNAIGVVTADEFTWIVHLGAIVLHRWEDGHALLTTDGLTEGARIRIVKGEVQS